MIHRRSFLSFSSIGAFIFGSGLSAFFPSQASSALIPGGWRELKIGGGGQLIGISQSDDGLSTVVNTDTAGAFLLNNTSGIWEELICLDTMPSDFVLPATPEQNHYGYYTYAIAVAPSDKDIAFLIYGNPNRSASWFFKCSNLTSSTPTWVQCRGYIGVFEDSNNEPNWPAIGPKMAVDPINAKVCYIGSESSNQHPQVTFDGGATFHSINDVPAATRVPGKSSVGGWCFDRTSTTISTMVFGQTGISRKATIWCVSSGNGVYRSTDGGINWSPVPDSPNDYYSMTIDKNDGTVYLTARDNSGFYRYKNDAWSPKILPNGIDGSGMVWMAPNPSTAGKVAAVGSFGKTVWSSNWGTTWTGNGILNKDISEIDVPWLAASTFSRHTIGTGQAMYDNVVLDKLWVNDGIGNWYTTSTSGDAKFRSSTAGIQQLVTNQIVSPWVAGSKTIIANWDRAVFAVSDPETYPTGYGPNYTGSNNDIQMGWDVDWASADPTHLALLNTWGTAKQINSGISSDGGSTWTPFADFPYPRNRNWVGGAIAMSDASHIAAALGNSGPLIFTKDAGATWIEEDLSAWGGRAANNSILTSVISTAAGTGGAGGTLGQVVCNVASTAALRTGDRWVPPSNIPDLASSNGQITVLNSRQFTCEGATWTASQSGAMTIYIATGNSFAYYINQFNVCADRKASNTFYYFNSNAASAGGGVYRISFPEDVYTISRVQNTPLTVSGANSKIRAVPYNGVSDTTGHLFYTPGRQNSSSLFYSTDGGANWKTVGTRANAVKQTWSFGFGKTKPGNDYPSVFIYGYVGNGALGVYQADATRVQWEKNSVTWTKIGDLRDFPRKYQTDLCACIEGDASLYGQVYLGFKGCGPMYRKI